MVCYEVVLQEGASLTDEAFSLDINYKVPKNNEPKTFHSAYSLDTITDGTSDNFQFVSSIVEFSLILRDSSYKGNANYTNLLHRMDAIPSVHLNQEKGEFFKMVYTAREKNLVVSKEYHELALITVYFDKYYSFYYHEAGQVLKAEDILEKLGFNGYCHYKHELFYDKTFTEPYTNIEVNGHLTLFVKTTIK